MSPSLNAKRIEDAISANGRSSCDIGCGFLSSLLYRQLDSTRMPRDLYSGMLDESG